MKFFSCIWIVALSVFAFCAHADTPKLTVYTYSSFVSEWGPGPAVEKAFETKCNCDLDFIGLEDGAALLSRLQLEGDHSQADIVLGLDTSLIAEATSTGLLAPHGLNIDELGLVIDWSDNFFLPYDYGHFAFVYDSSTITIPPDSLQTLVHDPNGPRVIIQDPRTSTPGLGLLLWMRMVFGDQAKEAWTTLAPRILTVTRGWTEAYGLFLAGEAPMVLSYTTSPAYHQHVEKTDRYKAAEFSEGHYAQIEVAAKLEASDHQTLADQFLLFMLSPAFQDLIPTTNWMFPVTLTSQPLPDAFERLVRPTRTLLFEPEQVATNRRNWAREWLEALSY